MINFFYKIKEKGILKSLVFILYSPIHLLLSKLIIFFTNRTKISEKYIIFKSNPDFSDNAKALYEYMTERYSDVKFIWLLNFNSQIRQNKRKNTIFIKETSEYYKGLSLKAVYYINKSKLIFFTQKGLFRFVPPRKGQLRINLWHGCGYKKAPIQKNNKKWIEDCYFDYVLVPGNVFIETKKEFFGCNEKQILPIGYPRYDLFFKKNTITENYVKNLKSGNKLVIWMPTFRTTSVINNKANYFPEEKNYINFDLPIFNSTEEVDKLNILCKKHNILLCIKRHPNQKKYSFENIFFSNIIFISNDDLDKENIDLYSLLKYTDALITDYSSIAIDYILLNKPIGFTLDDLKKYSDSRGFVFENPLKYMPGYHIYNVEDFYKCIKDISNNVDRFEKDRKEIIESIHNFSDNYCKTICDNIEIILNNLKECKNEN